MTTANKKASRTANKKASKKPVTEVTAAAGAAEATPEKPVTPKAEKAEKKAPAAPAWAADLGLSDAKYQHEQTWAKSFRDRFSGAEGLDDLEDDDLIRHWYTQRKAGVSMTEQRLLRLINPKVEDWMNAPKKAKAKSESSTEAEAA